MKTVSKPAKQQYIPIHTTGTFVWLDIDVIVMNVRIGNYYFKVISLQPYWLPNLSLIWSGRGLKVYHRICGAWESLVNGSCSCKRVETFDNLVIDWSHLQNNFRVLKCVKLHFPTLQWNAVKYITYQYMIKAFTDKISTAVPRWKYPFILYLLL